MDETAAIDAPAQAEIEGTGSNCLALYLAFFALCTVPWLGSYDFFTRGEAREALVVSDILLSGEWIAPRGYGGAVASKPPLFHWLAALIATCGLGLSELAVRLPSAIFSAAACLAFLSLLRSELSVTGRWIFAVVLLSSFEWLRASLTARVDMVHAASLSVALLAGHLAAERGSRPLWAAASAALALATLGKGPVALVLAVLCLGGWELLSARGRRRCAGVEIAMAVALAGAVASIWYAAAYLRAPGEVTERFMYENVQRMAGTMEDAPHAHSAVYLIGSFLLGLLPWTPLVLFAIYRHLPRSMPALRRLLSSAPTVAQFGILCIALITAFYSLPSSKRGVYLLACYPFVALVLASAFQSRLDIARLSRLKTFAFSTCIVLLLAHVVALRAMAALASERGLGELLAQASQAGGQIYSFRREFYGASYYSRLLIRRMRDRRARSGPVRYELPAAGDLVVLPERELGAAEEELKPAGLTVSQEGSIGIDGQTVLLLRARNATGTHLPLRLRPPE